MDWLIIKARLVAAGVAIGLALTAFGAAARECARGDEVHGQP